MKKIVLVVCLCLFVAGVATATPLTDYSLGNVGLNIGLGWSGSSSNASGSIIPGSKGDTAWLINQDFNNGSGGVFDIGLTVGLGQNIALRLKSSTFSGNTYTWNDQWQDPWWYTGDSLTGYVSDSEFDIMWQACSLDRTPFSLTVLLGFDAPIIGAVGSSSNGNTYQMSMLGGGVLGGLQAVVPLNDSTSIFANADIGSARWDVGGGVGFNLAQWCDFNLQVDYKSYNLNAFNSNLNGSVTSIQPKIGVDFRF